jgi:PAS domain S-box-containing protein
MNEPPFPEGPKIGRAGAEAIPEGLVHTLEWQEAIFEGSRDAIFICDEDSRFIAVNRAATELTGYSREELLRMRIPDLHEDVDLEAYRSFHALIMAGQGGLDEAMLLRKDRTKVPTEFSNTRIVIGGKRYMHTTARDVSQRHHAEVAMREREALYEQVINAANDAIVIFSPGGQILEANLALERQLGYSVDELKQMTITDLDTPEAARRVPGRIAKVKEEGHAIFETELERRDGSVVPTEASASVIEYRGTTAILAFLRDLSERKRADAALRNNEERFRTFFEQSPVGIYQTTPEGRILAASPALLKMLGYKSFDELAARDLEKEGFEPGYDRAMFKASLERDGEVWGLESVWTAMNGTPVFVRENARVVRGPDGGVLYYEGTVEDITRWTAVKQEHRRLTAAIEQAAEMIVITDVDGRIQYVNPAFELVTGYTRAEAIGQKPSILKSGRHDEAHYTGLWQTIKGGETWHGRFINRNKDGRLYEEDATISPIKDPSGTIVNFVAVKRDITQEVSMEAQLRQAQKLEAIGRLAGGVAHDFNNMLQAMLSHVQLLQREPHRQTAELAELEEQIRRGATLAQRLLLFSRPERAQHERVDVNEIVRGTCVLLRRVLRANIVLTTDVNKTPVFVEADRGQLDQVLVNLAINAADAMPGGGRLTIRTGRREDSAWFEVADTGTGIPDDIRHKLFDPFFTTKPAGKGTGLGLSIVHGIVTSHGGRVEVETEVGKGTTFRALIPAAAAPEEPVATPQPAESRLRSGHGERVLLVEDEAAARESLKEILVMLGYDVTAVGSGREAGVVPAQPKVDVLLSDIMLPDVDGVSIAQGLRDRWPNLRIILMSGYAEDEALGRMTDLGPVRFLQKPFDLATLAREIGSALDKEL